MARKFTPEAMKWINSASCLDSAFERKAMLEGLVTKGVFEENNRAIPFNIFKAPFVVEEEHKEQPAPKKNHLPAIWDLVLEDIAQRDSIGQKRYGTRLQPFNGRDVLRDAYEEALDLVVYLRQAIYERDYNGS